MKDIFLEVLLDIVVLAFTATLSAGMMMKGEVSCGGGKTQAVEAECN